MSSRQENVIKSINTSTLRGSSSTDTQKQELTAISSYNWLSRLTPEICVPGSPPHWVPKPPGTRLTPDSGLQLIDQNAYRNPHYPLEPLFLAVHSSNPGFNFSKIDLITDRNNLRKLLNFVTGNPKSFRIEVERVGRTTIFTRNEEKVSDEIPEGEFRGFGHQFEENYTEWPPGTTEGSTGHHRIIRYKFGGLHVLVRYAVDVCMPDSTAASPAEDDLSELIGGLALHENDHSQIRISREGNLVPQDSIGEIKTRAAYRKLEMSDVLPQLWFSDTSRLVVGYHHRRGQFDDVKELEMDSELEAWEEDNARDLQKLVELLGKISDAAKGAKNGKCLIIYRGDSSLDIVEPLTEKYRLPEYIRKKLEVSKVT